MVSSTPSGRRRRIRSPLDHIQAAERYAILIKYARMQRDGRTLMLCRPSRAELSDWSQRKESAGSDNKVIFSSRKKAEECIEELSKLSSTRPMIAYPCKRSHNGHHHIATDRETLYGRIKPKTKDPAVAQRRQERVERRRVAKRGQTEEGESAT